MCVSSLLASAITRLHFGAVLDSGFFFVVFFFLFVHFVLFETRSYCLGWPGIHCVDQAGLELTEIHLLLPPQCWG